MDRFVVDITQAVLLKDALHTTRPMSHAVETPSEISAVFDYISYEKGSCVKPHTNNTIIKYFSSEVQILILLSE